MKRLTCTAAVVVLALAGAASAANPNSIPASANGPFPEYCNFTGQVITGYYGGVGVHVSGTLNHFADGFPFAMRLGMGRVHVAAGDALAARRIFIDQNTNGSARSTASLWDARLDVIYPITLSSLRNTRVFGGPRHTSYSAYFEYVGGNETFNVISKQWGVGGGIETGFPVGERVALTFTLGADYYFRSTLSGHDTYYRPNGDDLHAKEDFTYKDADEAIKQPDVEGRLMFGVSYRF